jgi:DNA-binding LytR/AlgR family response regulator
MTKILIIEDEAAAARRLERLVLDVMPEAQLLGTLETVSDAVAWFAVNKEPDLVFADVHLADGNCFEIFKKVTVKAAVIFITAYDHYAIEAFKVNSIAYLLKPIKKDELAQSITKFKNLGWTHDLNHLLGSILNRPVNYQTRFIVKSGNYFKTIDFQQIALFMAEDKVVCIYTSDSKKYIIDLTLDKLVLAIDPQQFFRINRSCIINISTIARVASYTKGRVKIDPLHGLKTDLVVPADKVSNFKLWLEGRLGT